MSSFPEEPLAALATTVTEGFGVFMGLFGEAPLLQKTFKQPEEAAAYAAAVVRGLTTAAQLQARVEVHLVRVTTTVEVLEL